MIARATLVLAALALSACAGLEPAGRNADRAPSTSAPPPPAASAPPATTAAPAPAPPAPAVAAPDVSAPPPARPPVRRASDDDIVVPGENEGQVPAPAGDPRSRAERMEDIRAWDRCVMQVQSAFESDPMRPQLSSPEEYCSSTLGMSDRTAVPQSRLQRRR